MKWWSAEPVVFTERDYEGHRVRLLIAEKRARCSTRILDVHNPAPEYMSEINPDSVFPVFVDKNLLCYGAPLDELIHERYPGPPLLPVDPIKRAQMRMLAERVKTWYNLPADKIADELMEVANIYTGAFAYFAGNSISVIDIALAPLMACMPQKFLITAPDVFLEYRVRLMERESFQASLTSQLPYNEMAKTDDEFDDAMDEADEVAA